MPTALTPVSARPAITKPVGSDVFSLAVINAMAQSIADRAEWASKGLIVPYTKAFTLSDVDYPSGASYANLVNGGGGGGTSTLSIPDASVGDIILMHASDSAGFVGATPTWVYDLQISLESQVAQARFTVTATDNGGIEVPWSMTGMAVVGTAGTKTFAVQGKSGSAGKNLIGTGSATFRMSALHIKLGAA